MQTKKQAREQQLKLNDKKTKQNKPQVIIGGRGIKSTIYPKGHDYNAMYIQEAKERKQQEDLLWAILPKVFVGFIILVTWLNVTAPKQEVEETQPVNFEPSLLEKFWWNLNEN